MELLKCIVQQYEWGRKGSSSAVARLKVRKDVLFFLRFFVRCSTDKESCNLMKKYHIAFYYYIIHMQNLGDNEAINENSPYAEYWYVHII